MYEQLIKLDNKIRKTNNRIHSTSKVAPNFIGEDMFPQFQTGRNFNHQIVDQMKYDKVNDLWLSSQLFVKDIQFSTYHLKNEKNFFLSLHSFTYIEAIYLFTSQPVEFELISDNIELRIEHVGFSRVGEEYLISPLEEIQLNLFLERNTTISFALEIDYRMVL